MAHGIKAPRTLRGSAGIPLGGRDARAARTATMGCLLAAGTVGAADAQTPDASLPPVTVDAPVARPRPAASRPTPSQVAARNAIRRRAREAQASRSPPPAGQSAGGGLPTFARAADGNPYADPAAAYKADRVQSAKFAEPLLNTPRTVTVLTKEVLQDKNATSLREVARSTSGITIGTGEGGNAFGDRFFIRGFDARNDVFVDGVRDPAVSIRENFFTEQVEILRGPGSTFAGRGIAGGALNIVTKQAGDRDFAKAETQFGTTGDNTRRVTLDVNKVVTPDFSIRLNGLGQLAGIAGRNFVTDDRVGGAVAVKMTPTDRFTLTANYIKTELKALPDFGVPFYRQTIGGRVVGNLQPATETFLPRESFYGFVNRDFQRTSQDIGTVRGEFRANDDVTLSNTLRVGRSTLDYVGTLPQGPNFSNLNPALWTLNAAPQSRYQTAEVVTDQTDLTVKFNTWDVRHTVVAGTEIARERVGRENYSGLNSELFGTFTSNGASTVSLFNPPNLLPFNRQPTRSGIRTVVPVDTNSAYIIENANWNDVVILNTGIRYDNYNVQSRSFNPTNAAQSGSVSATSNLVNYNAGLVVKPVPEASLYAAFATSSNPVGAELDASGTDYGGLSPTGGTNQVLPPEKNTAYEVGAKYELFDRHLLATAAYFQTIKDNARETSGSSILASGRYKVEGFDFGLTGKITDRWSVFGGLTLFETEVEKSISPINRGLRLANLANRSFSMLTKYRVNGWLELGGQAIYASKIYGGTFAANNNTLPDHWRFDAFAETRINENFKLTLNVQNIFDTVYYDAFYRSAVPFVFVAPGRTVTLIAQARF